MTDLNQTPLTRGYFVFALALGLVAAIPLKFLVGTIFGPSRLVFLVYSVIWSVMSALFLHKRLERGEIALIAVFTIVLVGIYGSPLTQRERFRAATAEIQVGDSKGVVRKRMEGFQAADNIQSRPGENCEFYRHTLGDHDLGIICFESERVISVDFSPD